MKYYLVHTICAMLAFIIISFVDMNLIEDSTTIDVAAKSFLVTLIIFIAYYYLQLNRHSKFYD